LKLVLVLKRGLYSEGNVSAWLVSMFLRCLGCICTITIKTFVNPVEKGSFILLF